MGTDYIQHSMLLNVTTRRRILTFEGGFGEFNRRGGYLSSAGDSV